jgi:hypothetical protein
MTSGFKSSISQLHVAVIPASKVFLPYALLVNAGLGVAGKTNAVRWVHVSAPFLARLVFFTKGFTRFSHNAPRSSYYCGAKSATRLWGNEVGRKSTDKNALGALF